MYLCACVYVFFSDYAFNSGILENSEKMKPRFELIFFHLKKTLFFFLNLAAPGLSCSVKNLLVAAFKLLVLASGT